MSTRLAGVKRRRTDRQAGEGFNQPHFSDRIADREPTYSVNVEAPQSVIVISNEKRKNGGSFNFTQEIGTIPNAGRIRVKKISVDHLWDNINDANRVVTFTYFDNSASLTATLTTTLTTGHYTDDGFIAHFNAAMVTTIAAAISAGQLAAGCSVVIAKQDLADSSGTAYPTNTRQELNITLPDNLDYVEFEISSFFSFGNTVHGLSQRTAPAHITSISPTGWYPPARITNAAGGIAPHNGPANYIGSRYYIVESKNLTRGTKMLSYGITTSALGIFYCHTPYQGGLDKDMFTQEEQELDNAHSISCSLTRQVGGDVDIRIIDEWGNVPTSYYKNPHFSLTLVVSKHY